MGELADEEMKDKAEMRDGKGREMKVQRPTEAINGMEKQS